MTRILLHIASLLLCYTVLGQQNQLPLHSYYKDRLFHGNARQTAYTGNAFFPLTEDAYNLHQKIADTSRQYYEFTYRLFQKHLFEIKGENYYLTISPVFDFALGRDLADTAQRRLFQNTRGFHIEGDLFRNFSFSTSLYENQSRHAYYQSNYYQLIGERYVNSADSSYSVFNAVVPGSARTKSFKGDGFDYAYAVGSIVYKPWKVLTIRAGNTAHFIGNGYRSLLLSDNSCPAPFYQLNYRFAPRWEFVYLRSKFLNLLRRPASTTAEAYYEAKGYAVNYLSFQATPTLNIAVFEGTVYSRGDSVTSTHSHPLYYNPIPGLSAFLLGDQEVNAILGLDIGYSPSQQVRIYTQFAYNNKSEGYGAQLGIRLSEPFDWSNCFFQLEWNHASNTLYQSVNPRLNYSHYNLPLAHSKGGGFSEFVLRANYEWKRLYIDFKSIYYLLNAYRADAHLPVYSTSTEVSGSVWNGELEGGYRFNRKMNFSIFLRTLIRTDAASNPVNTQIFAIGMRTALRNIYNDF